MAVVHVGEIVEACENAKTDDEIVEILSKHKDNVPFRTFLNYAYNPGIVFYDFDGKYPDFEESPYHYGQNAALYSRVKMLSTLIYEPDRNYPYDRMCMVLVRVLESIPAYEAQLTLDMLKGKGLKNIKIKHIVEAFPGDERFQRLVAHMEPEQEAQSDSDTESAREDQTEKTTEEANTGSKETETVEPPVKKKRGPGRPSKKQKEEEAAAELARANARKAEEAKKKDS